MDRFARLLCAAVLIGVSACAGPSRRSSLTSGPSQSDSVECAPYARQITGLQLYGDAADWWDAAAGQYQRNSQPTPGSVLVFQRSSRLPHGHVSVVRSLQSEREITVTQANWVHGRIAANEPVVDVSPGNDWSEVRVWWEPAGQLGNTIYPAFGFVSDTSPPAETARQTSDSRYGGNTR